MYDYDRKDKFGNKRELHVDKALDVVDTRKYEPFNSGSLDSTEVQNCHTLVSCKYFECFKYDIDGECNIGVDQTSFISIVVISGSGEIDISETEEKKNFKAGESFFITAGQKNIYITGIAEVIVTRV